MMTIKFQKALYTQNKFFYSIIIISDKKKPSSGGFIEKIGFFHPKPNEWKHKKIFINMDRLFFWLSRGVKMNKSLYVLIKPLLDLDLKKKL